MPKHEGPTRTDLKKYTYRPKRLVPGENPDPEPTAEQLAAAKSVLAATRVPADVGERVRLVSSPTTAPRNERPLVRAAVPAHPPQHVGPTVYGRPSVLRHPLRAAWRLVLRAMGAPS